MKSTVDDALVEINRLRAINQQLLAALKAACIELMLVPGHALDRTPLYLKIEAAMKARSNSRKGHHDASLSSR